MGEFRSSDAEGVIPLGWVNSQMSAGLSGTNMKNRNILLPDEGLPNSASNDCARRPCDAVRGRQ